MHTCSQLFRRGAVYYFRQQIRFADGSPYRIAISLLTRRLDVAKTRAVHLASAAFFLQRTLDRATPPIPFQDRVQIFRQQLLLERDRCEALHLDVLSQIPTDADPADYVDSIFDGVQRFSHALVRFGLPNRAVLERLASDGLQASSETVKMWKSEVAQTIRKFNLAESDDMQRAMLKLVHEARVAAISEFRERLEKPETSYAAALRPAGLSNSNHENHVSLRFESSSSSDRNHLRGTSAQESAQRCSQTDLWLRLTVAEAAEKYKASQPKTGLGASPKLKNAKRVWDLKTLRQFDSAVMLLNKSFPGPISSLTQNDLDYFASLLDRLPARGHHKSKRHDSMSLEEIALEAADQVAAGDLDPSQIGLMPQTTNRHFRFLREMCNWIQKRAPAMAKLDWSDFLIEETRDKREQRAAFSIEQANMLFLLPTWTGFECISKRNKPGDSLVHDAGYWIPLLALYTGCRREEVAKLLVSDVVEEAGIPILRIADSETGRVKTARSNRLVPVAAELIRLGFLEFVGAMQSEGRNVLFPDLIPGTSSRKMGDVYYKRFWMPLTPMLPFLQDGQAIHAFRHTVSTELKDAEVFDEVRSDLLGHASENPMADLYSKATRVLKLKAIVDQIPIATAHLSPRTINLYRGNWLPETDTARPRLRRRDYGKSVTGSPPLTPAKRANQRSRRERTATLELSRVRNRRKK